MKTEILGFWSDWNEGKASIEGSPLWSDAVVAHVGHPINELTRRAGLVAGFLDPLRRAFPDVSRETAIAISGEFSGGSWVASYGHYVGTFAQEFLGIPATRRVASLRFGEFCRVENGTIVEVYAILDWIDLMRQAGVYPLAPPLGSAEAWPAPSTHDGIVEAASQRETEKSLRLVEAMIGGLMEYDGKTLESMGMPRFWTPSMMWYGPAGIGSTRGLAGFQDHHQRSFLAAFPDRRGGNHKCRIAEGGYVASTGWPSIRATHQGSGFLGLPPTGRPITMRVMDFWRRDGDLLAENWVFIDLPDLLMQMGLDVFEQMRDRAPGLA